jgi:hypothetical protein
MPTDASGATPGNVAPGDIPSAAGDTLRTLCALSFRARFRTHQMRLHPQRRTLRTNEPTTPDNSPRRLPQPEKVVFSPAVTIWERPACRRPERLASQLHPQNIHLKYTHVR